MVLLSTDFSDIETDEDENNEIALFTHPCKVQTSSTSTLDQIIPQFQYDHNGNVDILEITGGPGHGLRDRNLTKTAFRHGLSSGSHQYCNISGDINDLETQKAILYYLHTVDVLTVVIQPNCRSLAHSAEYAQYTKIFQRDKPHLQFCGAVANIQQKKGRKWIVMYPKGCWLTGIPPWPDLMKTRPYRVDMHQCMAGSNDEHGSPILGPTTWLSNDRPDTP